MRDDQVVGKAGEGLADGSIALAFSFLSASFHTECRVGGHSDTRGCRVRMLFIEASEKSVTNVLLSRNKS